MKNSLKAIQVLSQIGRVLSKIVWICCIVGAAGCLVGIASLAVGADEVFKIGGVTIYGFAFWLRKKKNNFLTLPLEDNLK